MYKIKTIFKNKLDILIEKVTHAYGKNLNFTKYCSPKSKFSPYPGHWVNFLRATLIITYSSRNRQIELMQTSSSACVYVIFVYIRHMFFCTLLLLFFKSRTYHGSLYILTLKSNKLLYCVDLHTLFILASYSCAGILFPDVYFNISRNIFCPLQEV